MTKKIKGGNVFLEDDSNMEHWEEILPVLVDYATLLEVEIVVSNPHGKAVEPRTDKGWLYIRFWSTPGKCIKDEIPSAFGIKLSSGQRDSCKPSRKGTILMDPDGVAVAEVVGGTLYVLFDLPHGDNAGILIQKIMEEYLLYKKNPKHIQRIKREYDKKKLQISREAYVKECRKQVDQMLKEAKEGIEKAEKKIKVAIQTIVQATRKRDELLRKINFLESSTTGFDKKFAEEFEKLFTIPGVVDVVVRNGIISVLTEDITIPYDGKLYDVGRFRINIHTDGSNGGVRCYNLTRKVEGYYHPHVNGNGECCLGNISEGVAKLIASCEYLVLIQLMIQYLRSVNPNGWYKSIEYWPKKRR